MTFLDHDREIGRIEGKLDRLIETQNHILRKWEEMNRDLINLTRRQDAQAHELVNFKRRLGAVEQPAHEFGRWRERALGALMLLSLTGALIGGGLVAFWQKMSGLIR